MNRVLCVLVVMFGVAVLGFFVSDLFGGGEGGTVAVITGKYYVPERTTVTIGSEGTTIVDTSPEEFHVLSTDIETGEAFDIQAGREYSDWVTNGQVVSVRWVVGKWTGWRLGYCYGD